ncbi:MAG: dipeptidase [Bacillota bacterium]
MTAKNSPAARELHDRAIVIDAHCDTLMSTLLGKRDLAHRSKEGHIDLPRLREGGVTCQFFAMYIEPQFKPARAARRTLQFLDEFHRQLAMTEGLVLATSAQDIRDAKRQGHVAALLSIEGGEAIEGDLALLRMFHRLGVRAMGLTWNERNDIADGAGEVGAKGGLSQFGVTVVREMNDLGMLVDVSHLAEASFWSVVEHTTAPIIASHSNAYALSNHRRNLNDDQLRAMARLGGVVGVVFAPNFVEIRGQASLVRLVDHIDHIATVAGIDCAGLGSDFDGYGVPPHCTGVMDDASQLPLITGELLRRGYTDEQVLKVLGGNFLRVIQEVVG